MERILTAFLLYIPNLPYPPYWAYKKQEAVSRTAPCLTHFHHFRGFALSSD